jgi:hypothetical protein
LLVTVDGFLKELIGTGQQKTNRCGLVGRIPIIKPLCLVSKLAL